MQTATIQVQPSTEELVQQEIEEGIVKKPRKKSIKLTKAQLNKVRKFSQS